MGCASGSAGSRGWLGVGGVGGLWRYEEGGVTPPLQNSVSADAPKRARKPRPYRIACLPASRRGRGNLAPTGSTRLMASGRGRAVPRLAAVPASRGSPPTAGSGSIPGRRPRPYRIWVHRRGRDIPCGLLQQGDELIAGQSSRFDDAQVSPRPRARLCQGITTRDSSRARLRTT